MTVETVTPPAAVSGSATPPAEGLPAAGAPAAPAAPAVIAAPVPVPIEVKLDGVAPEALTAFKGVAGEVGLDSAKAQKVADFYGKLTADQKAASDAKFTATQKDWEALLKADKDFGGPNFEKNTAIAKKGLELAGKEFAGILHQTGLGSHPAIVKFFHALGKQQKEDSTVGLTGGSPSAKNDADFHRELYPSMHK